MYTQSNTLEKLIDWENIMKMERCAGGHDEQMKWLFKNAKLIGHYKEGCYQGEVATCVQLEDDRYVIYNDYYGSCSGCDSWENANDEEVEYMCKNLANSAYIFENIFGTIEDVINFLSLENVENYSWSKNLRKGLLEEIKNNKEYLWLK